MVPISIPVLPTLLQDVIDRTNKWAGDGITGRIDPFTEVHDVSFPSETGIVVELVLSFPLAARFPNDCPYYHMPRPGEERSRSQENQRAIHGPPDERNPHVVALPLVP